MGEWLQCLECEEELRFPQLLCLYWLGTASEEPSYRNGQWVRVLQVPIWCSACNRLSYAERVPSLREFEVASAIRRMTDRRVVGEVDDELLTLSEQEFLQLSTGLRDRSTAGACVLCGGRAYLPLELHHGRARNIRHEHCGGEFEHKIWIASSVGNREVQWYEFSGKLMLKQNDFF